MKSNNKRKNMTTKNTSKNLSNQQPIHGFDLTILCQYLAVRAQEEGVEFTLTEMCLAAMFAKGTRNFFGIEVNNIGFPLWDDQERSRGSLNNFICWFFLNN